MKFWRLWAAEQTMMFSRASNEDDKAFSDLFLNHFNGKPMASWYKPIKLMIQKKGKKHDFPDILPGVLIFSKKARAIMEPLVGPYIEFLEVDHSEIQGIEINLANVTNVIDALDYDHSELTYFASGRISCIKKVSFHLDKVINHPIFKIPENKAHIYVTDEFRDLVIKSKLKGLEFEEVWDSENIEEKEKARKQQYEALLAAIEQSKGPEVSFSEALALVNAGKAMASGQWKLQAHPVDGVLLGDLMWDGSYSWIDPLFYPPILLELQWHEVEISEIGGK